MSQLETILRAHGVTLEQIDREMIPGRRKLSAQARQTREALIQPVRMDIVEWARENVIIPSELGYSGGSFEPLTPQVGIINSWHEPGIERIWFQKVPRLGSSFITAIGMLYTACHEAKDTIFYERTEKECQRFHDSFIHPILAGSPNLKHLLRPSHRDKWHDKVLTNGAAMRFRSVQKDGSFRGIKGLNLFCDEVSSPEWQLGDGDEGDKTDLAFKRAEEFGEGRMFSGSSPTHSSYCTVSRNYGHSDKRVYRVPCPRCGCEQEFLPVVQPGEGPGLYYNVDEFGRLANRSDPKSGLVVPDCWYQCVQCEFQIRESMKSELLKVGQWHATTVADRRGYAGFFMWAAYSENPLSRWFHIAEQHQAQLTDASKRASFKNTWLGQPTDDDDARPVEVNWLRKRRAWAYPAPCPPPIRLITCGSDNQQGAQSQEKRDRTGKTARSEVSVIGWGPQERSYLLAHIIIPHAPFTPESNEAKIKIMQTYFAKPDGELVPPAGMGDDIGDGNTMDRALQFISSPEARKVGILGFKGANEAKGARRPTISAGRAKAGVFEFDLIGTQSAKSIIMKRLLLDGFGPETILFPESFDNSYYKSLTSVVLKTDDKATWWEDRPGNEALDCFVYAYARLLLIRRTRPLISQRLDALPFEDEEVMKWMMEHKNKTDRSWQSPLVEEERRLSGGMTADEYSIRRMSKNMIRNPSSTAPAIPSLPAAHQTAQGGPKPHGYFDGPVPGQRPGAAAQPKANPYGPVNAGRRGW